MIISVSEPHPAYSVRFKIITLTCIRNTRRLRCPSVSALANTIQSPGGVTGAVSPKGLWTARPPAAVVYNASPQPLGAFVGPRYAVVKPRERILVPIVCISCVVNAIADTGQGLRQFRATVVVFWSQLQFESLASLNGAARAGVCAEE